MDNWEKQESSFLRQEYKRLTVQNEALSAELKRARKDLEHEKEKRFEMCMACELRKAEKPSVYEQTVQGLQEAIEYEKRRGNQ